MITRNDYPHGVPCWVDTEQPDPDAATAFYGGLFGWDFIERAPGYHVAAARLRRRRDRDRSHGHATGVEYLPLGRQRRRRRSAGEVACFFRESVEAVPSYHLWIVQPDGS